MPSLSVIVCTHNPHLDRLTRTVAGLCAQSLNQDQWELLIIDNASQDQTVFNNLDYKRHPHARVVHENKLGLTSARLRGFAESDGEIMVMVDDDNILAPDYLEKAAKAFADDTTLGAVGGRSLPEFESPPPDWLREFDGLLALRDLGDSPEKASWSDATPHTYPSCAPIGAGLALRRGSAASYADALSKDSRRRAFDRTGSQLISGGDNDLVMTVLESGLTVAYMPELQLTHLIPSRRMLPEYLGALNRAIARSWIRVLAFHGIRPWLSIKRASVPLRQARSWVRTRACAGVAGWIRWQGACGHFEGLADLNEIKS